MRRARADEHLYRCICVRISPGPARLGAPSLHIGQPPRMAPAPARTKQQRNNPMSSHSKFEYTPSLTPNTLLWRRHTHTHAPRTGGRSDMIGSGGVAAMATSVKQLTGLESLSLR